MMSGPHSVDAQAGAHAQGGAAQLGGFPVGQPAQVRRSDDRAVGQGHLVAHHGHARAVGTQRPP